MYKIFSDKNEIWSPNLNTHKLEKPTLKLATNSVGSLSFTMYPGHPFYNSLIKMQSVITVRQDNEILFKGRIYSDKADFRKAKKVEVEGLLGYFNDSIVRPYEYKGSVKGYVKFLIDQHNDQEPESKRFKLGDVTVTDPNDLIVRASSEYPKTWDEMTSKLVDNMGGYIVIRYEDDGNYIDYLADYKSISKQKIQYAVNLLDLTNEVKADNLATCIIPLGKAGDDNSRLTIKSVNNGVDYIYDPIAEAIYGRITRVVTWDDVTLPANLLSKAKTYLATSAMLEGTLTIKAVDLHLSDKEVEAFRIGYYIPVYSRPHDVNEVMLLNSISIILSEPDSFTFSLGRTKSSFVDTQFKSNKTTQIEAIQLAISEVTNEVKEVSNDVKNSINNNQGATNAGKYLGINSDGSVVAVDLPDLDIQGLAVKNSLALVDEFPIYGVNVEGNRKITWNTIQTTILIAVSQGYAKIAHKHEITNITGLSEKLEELESKIKALTGSGGEEGN